MNTEHNPERRLIPVSYLPTSLQEIITLRGVITFPGRDPSGWDLARAITAAV